MPFFANPLPLSLYIHLPWCIRKCPYCDFNSHALKKDLPEELYTNALLEDFRRKLLLIEKRPLISIFFGGGTPSLFSGASFARLLNEIAKHIHFDAQIEITLEANPGTIDQTRFHEFYQAGINRLSIGIQSFDEKKLKVLGRIHDKAQAIRAIELAKKAGFHNFNLDLMYGLPNQTQIEAQSDIEIALSFEPTHLSWYQLTLEPNTLFFKYPPPLPTDEAIWEMQTANQHILYQAGLKQYEISAYARSRECLHNRNYWEFGDYLGIGAGAHSKITNHATHEVIRFSELKHPKDYLEKYLNKATTKQNKDIKILSQEDLVIEFMLNALRLTGGFRTALFAERTGLEFSHITPKVQQALQRNLLHHDANRIQPTELGFKFLNDLTAIFL